MKSINKLFLFSSLALALFSCSTTGEYYVKKSYSDIKVCQERDSSEEPGIKFKFMGFDIATLSGKEREIKISDKIFKAVKDTNTIYPEYFLSTVTLHATESYSYYWFGSTSSKVKLYDDSISTSKSVYIAFGQDSEIDSTWDFYIGSNKISTERQKIIF